MKTQLNKFNIGKVLNPKILALTLIFSYASQGFAEAAATPAPASSTVQTKVIMSQFLDQLNAVKKYMTSETRFSDPKNMLEISEHLKQFGQIADASMHDPLLQMDNFKMSRDVLVKHIHETEKVFKEGNKSYARWMLNSTIYMCMSCHTQMPSEDKRLLLTKDGKNYFTQFEQAEFLFASRNFTEASRIYDQVIRGSLKDDAADVERALRRQVAYFARIKRAPKEAISLFNEYLKIKNMPEFLTRDISNWISQFEQWNKEKMINPEQATDKEIQRFVSEHLELDKKSKVNSVNAGLVNYLHISGVLYEYLQTHPKTKIKAQVLYWLALCDRSVERNFFFSLADLYLRECIVNHAADPIAKKCYVEYEKETTLGYSGSRGVDVPDSVRRDLKALKALVDSGGKIKLDSKE